MSATMERRVTALDILAFWFYAAIVGCALGGFIAWYLALSTDRAWLAIEGHDLAAVLQDDELPSNFVPHGSLLVDAELEPDFERAVWYIRHDSAMRAVVDHVERASFRTELVLAECREGDHFDGDGRIVAWNPLAAARDDYGPTLSPALSLGHELAHAELATDKADALQSVSDDDYDTAEERRVITGPERHAAITLGEGVRYDHHGDPFVVASVTSRVPDDSMSRLLRAACAMRGGW